jgi:hypothetical protein
MDGALYQAAENGHETVCGCCWSTRWMLIRRISKDNDGRTALHPAAENGHEVVVQLLLKHMVDVDAKDNDGRMAIHLAAENGH